MFVANHDNLAEGYDLPNPYARHMIPLRIAADCPTYSLAPSVREHRLAYIVR